MLFQRLAQMAIVEVGVNLGCEDIFVAEQLLHLSYVGTALQQMRSKGVSEGVGADFFVYASTLRRLLYDGENHHARELLAAIVEEQNLLLLLLFLTHVHIELYAATRYATHRHKALLITLANYADITLGEEYITQL